MTVVTLSCEVSMLLRDRGIGVSWKDVRKMVEASFPAYLDFIEKWLRSTSKPT